MSIDAENPTPDRFAAMALEAIERAVEGFRRRLAGLQQTISTLAADNGRLRERVKELERHIEATAGARVDRHPSGAGGPLATLTAPQRGMLWAALTCQAEMLAASYRTGLLPYAPAPHRGSPAALCRVRDILLPDGKPEPESGGENLAGG